MAGIPTLDQLHNRPDPAMNDRWACADATLPLGLPSHYLEGANIPFNNVKIGETIYLGSGYDNFAGSHTIGSLTLSLYEDQVGTALKWLMFWKSKIKDFSTGFYGLPGDGSKTSTGYKQGMTLQLLNNQNQSFVSFDFNGLWPEATSDYALSYNEAGRLVLSQAFSVDDCVVRFS